MRLEWLKRPFNSVFTKLIAVMLVSGSLLVIVISAISWHGFRENRRIFFQNNLAQYGTYLVRDLQENLNLEYARELSQRLFLIIRFEGKKDSWQTASGIPHLDKVNFRKLEEKSRTPVNPKFSGFETKFSFGRHQKQGIVIVDTEAGRFIIAGSDSWSDLRQVLPWILTILGLIGLILLGAWLTLRWILKPINWLSGGVVALGKGNLEHRLPEKRGDELGDLSLAFNQMSERIREMLLAREQLLLDVSHELRSPLTRMKVALEFIPEDDSRESLLDDVQEMEQMVTEILETARLKSEYGQLNLQKTDLVKLIQDICIIFEGQTPGIRFENAPETCQTFADAEQIETVLKNLLTNALKYSPAENAPVEIRLKKSDAGTLIEIQDHGPGIQDGELDLIFEPFYRTDKSRNRKNGGYGLGLSLCKTIIEAHGGTIDVQSNTLKGAMFSVHLPKSPSTI
jgi:signal transduction histidine kinase